jgi:Flp pilus assembly protein TadD
VLRCGFGFVLSSAAVLGWQGSGEPARQIVADLQSGRFSEAKTLADAALKSRPHDPRLWTFDGLALEQLGERSQARAAFDRALQIAPNYIPALERAAQIAYDEESPRAPVLLGRLEKLRPDDVTTHALLAQLAFKNGHCEEAKTELSKSGVHRTDPTDSLREYGACLVAAKRTADAIPVFEELRRWQPGSSEAAYDCAVVEFLAGHFQETLATLASMPARDGDALDLAAQAHQELGQAAAAEQCLRSAIATKPNESRYYADLAYLLQASGRFQQGLDTANLGLEKCPSAALYVARGVLYDELGKYQLGDADFEKAQELDPNVEIVSAAEGLSELQRNDLPQAELRVRERLAKEPNNAFLHYLLAEILLRRGAVAGSKEFSEAVASAQQAVQLDPKLLLAHQALGRLYLKKGEYDKAIAQTRHVYEASPSDPKALYQYILALRKGEQTADIPQLSRKLAMLRAREGAEQSLEMK